MAPKRPPKPSLYGNMKADGTPLTYKRDRRGDTIPTSVVTEKGRIPLPSELPDTRRTGAKKKPAAAPKKTAQKSAPAKKKPAAREKETGFAGSVLQPNRAPASSSASASASKPKPKPKSKGPPPPPPPPPPSPSNTQYTRQQALERVYNQYIEETKKLNDRYHLTINKRLEHASYNDAPDYINHYEF